jgi:gas vesicle protein GvpN
MTSAIRNGNGSVDGKVVLTRPRSDFVETDFVREVTDRALTYIGAGYPVHFRGPSGSGKTTLALHVAHRLGRPISLLCGDDEFGMSDLVGGQFGYRRRKVIDNFVHSVLKTEEDLVQHWVDNRLTVACREGFSLVYDEFSRSKPEANNVLLAVLEEKLLMLPTSKDGMQYMKVHPSFVAIFTSNPEEYVGVHGTQDALLDRMVTIDVAGFDRETEIAIAQAKSGIGLGDAERIVDLVRSWRGTAARVGPTVRSSVMIAKVLKLREAHANPDDEIFAQASVDVLLGSPSAGNTHANRTEAIASLRSLIGRQAHAQS